MKRSVTFKLKLFDDTVENVAVMSEIDVMFDDRRNNVPHAYWEIIGSVEFGKTLEFTVREVD